VKENRKIITMVPWKMPILNIEDVALSLSRHPRQAKYFSPHTV
jgi:hypothetical protein